MENIYTLENIEFDFPKNLPIPSDELLKIIDLGNDISLVRHKLSHNLSLLNNPRIQKTLHKYLCQCVELIIPYWDEKSNKYSNISQDESIDEEKRTEYVEASEILDALIIILRIYRCWVIRYKHDKELGLLGNIKVPIFESETQDVKSGFSNIGETKSKGADTKPDRQKLSEFIAKSKFLKSLINGIILFDGTNEEDKYSNHIFLIFYFEAFHFIDVAVKERAFEPNYIPSYRIKQLQEHLEGIVIRKFENIFNRSIKSKKTENAISNLLTIKINQKTGQGLVKFSADYMEEEKKEIGWCFAYGLRQMATWEVNKYLNIQWKKYDGENYFEFVEDSMNQYLHAIQPSQQKKARQWLQNPNIQITPSKEVSTPLNIPHTPKIPKDKLVFTIDIKHFVYLMQALRKERTPKGQTLEANDGAIMGFIIRNFCNKNCKPIKEKDLIPYFEEDTKSNKDMMTWNQTDTKLANVFYELFMEGVDTPFLKCRNMMKTLPKIIANSFTGKEESILAKTINRCLYDDRRPPQSKRSPVHKHMKLEK